MEANWSLWVLIGSYSFSLILWVLMCFYGSLFVLAVSNRFQ